MIRIAARASNLSRAQVQEVIDELYELYPDLYFEPIYLETMGDKDKSRSLRDLDKSDFFTREIDELLLSKGCEFTVHSAKDLPDPLPKGLVVAALTCGVDPADVLVMPEGISFEKIPFGGVIATSSLRREENVRAMRKDLTFIDIRGTIEERLNKLLKQEVHGVVMAEAALIRLKLTHLNRIKIEGEVALHQGRLALVACQENIKIRQLLASLNSQ